MDWLRDLFIGMTSGLVSGVIAGFLVYWSIGAMRHRQWSSAKRHLVKSLNITLNAILSSLRSALDILPPDIESDSQMLDFFKAELLDRFDTHKTNIEYMSAEKQAVLFSNLRNAQDSLRQLAPLFVSFAAANPWYVEAVFELFDKIQSVSIPYSTFPEIGKAEFDQDDSLIGMRHLASDSVHSLCRLGIETKSNPLIRDVLKDTDGIIRFR